MNAKKIIKVNHIIKDINEYKEIINGIINKLNVIKIIQNIIMILIMIYMKYLK